MPAPSDDDIRMDDPETAARMFRHCEPELRAAVRRRMTPAMRAKFDSADVVQSTLMDCWRHFRAEGGDFQAEGKVRGYLLCAAVRHLIDFIRHFHHSLDETPIPPASELDAACRKARTGIADLEADDLFERFLNLCSPTQRTVMLARREGMTSAEIAAATGLHKASVRRIIRETGRTLAEFLEESDADTRPDAPEFERQHSSG